MVRRERKGSREGEEFGRRGRWRERRKEEGKKRRRED
jgi:hypothetical protein